MFQSGNVVFVVEHRLVITRIFGVNLILETLRLIFCIVQFAETVTDLTSADEEFEAIGDFRVYVITTRQRRTFGRVLGNEGRVNQVRFRDFFEDLSHDTAQTPALLNFDAGFFSCPKHFFFQTNFPPLLNPEKI